MAFKFNRDALKRAEETIASGEDDSNPFMREGETTFMRHDELRVIQDQPGVVEVEFRWRGKPTYTMIVGCDFSDGQTLTLAGIDGRMAMQIT